MATTTVPENNEFTIGWICALPEEYAAAVAVLDEQYDPPVSKATNDQNNYTTGRLGQHKVVIAVCPAGQYGTTSAASVARDMVHSFINIRIGLMVGVGGGIPSTEHDIRLGDVVVAMPSNGRPAVIQYDMGKRLEDGSFHCTSILSQPPQVLLAAINGLRMRLERGDISIRQEIKKSLERLPRKAMTKRYSKPPDATDVLYHADFSHVDIPQVSAPTCCPITTDNHSRRELRTEEDDDPAVHYGPIGSADTLVKDAKVRQSLAKNHGILCVEMEAAGLMNHFPCVVVRGICDYADSHKNKQWQPYAAMSAAAYARVLVLRLLPNQVEYQKKLRLLLLQQHEETSEKLDLIVKTTMAAQETMSNWQDSELLRTIKEWLRPPDHSASHGRARERHFEGTGQWLLNSDIFRRWLTSGNSFLWLHGLPGSGKTILTSSVVEYLRESSFCTTLLYFYFDLGDISQTHIEGAVRSLLVQLCTYSTKHCQTLQALWLACGRGSEQPLVQDLQQTLSAILATLPEAWIIIDALDECDTEDEHLTSRVLPWIHQTVSGSANVHLLATSRPLSKIQQSFASWVDDTQIWQITSTEQDEDISNYVKARVHHSDGFRRWSERPGTRNMIAEGVVEKAHGMFRLAALQLDSLKNCPDHRSLTDALRELPKGLFTMYDQIIKGIPSALITGTKRILMLLAFSNYPIDLADLVDALAVRTSPEYTYSADDRMGDPNEITAYCPGLISLHGTDDHRHVRLAHSSVREYLMSNRKDAPQQLRLDEDASRNEAAIVYLTYILSEAERSSDSEALRDATFTLHCASSLVPNIARCQILNQDVLRLLSTFLSHDKLFQALLDWIIPLEWHEFGHEVESGPIGPTYFAACLGNSSVMNLVLESHPDLNQKGGQYGTPLGAAISRHNVPLVNLLLDSGADVGADCDSHGTPLSLAAAKGHLTLVKLLLQRGADVDDVGASGNSPLISAVFHGHLDVVQSLIIAGARTDVTERHYYTDQLFGALSAACRIESEPIVRLLLQHGADVNGRGLQEEVVPMDAAMDNGNFSIAALLILEGARPHKEGYYSCYLDQATRQGNFDMLDLLIQANAIVNSYHDLSCQALFSALISKREDMANLLLDHGANPNSKCKYSGDSCLATSILSVLPSIAHRLIEMGADIAFRTRGGMSALDCAAKRGLVDLIEEIHRRRIHDRTWIDDLDRAVQHAIEGKHQKAVQRLLDLGANVHKYNIALNSAMYDLDSEQLRLAIFAGADVDAFIAKDFFPFQVSIFRGKDDFLVTLLDSGFDVDVLDADGKSALYHSCELGCQGMTKLLLDRGADVNAGSLHGQFPLAAAAKRGDLDLVQSLLDRGAKVNPNDAHGDSLYLAAREGHTDIVKLLLANGAEISAVTSKGGTLLSAAQQRGHVEVECLLVEGVTSSREPELIPTGFSAKPEGT
ncbi:Ankyrin repeat-containing protein 13 [Elsinoe fawcettii]|nr:Ankyrin repeat-containing protein 13 [Elsinoe fawcettii]